MRLIKIHKRIDIENNIGNVKITSTHYSKPIENSNKWEQYTTINCWYDRDCENCPMGWEDMSYEGECNDCGCIFDHDFNVTIWKCMLPKWIKRILERHYRKTLQKADTKMTMTNSETINIMDCEAGRIFNGEQIRRKNAIKSGCVRVRIYEQT